MRKSSFGRKSSTNPSRSSAMDRDDKNSNFVRSEPRVSSNPMRVIRQSSGDASQIPRPRIRSVSSDRASSIRKSNLKVPGKTSIGGGHLLTTPTPGRVSSNRIHPDLPTGFRGRSPSAERASGMSNNANQKKDSRPLTDKNYQTAMLNRIDNFFRDANQLSILNPNGSLKPVSLKIFVNASDFLLQLLDTKHNFTINDYMEELPKIAKKLHYPGTMTKSWLKTANTMHSWHHVLGWLSWLVEICEVKDLATEQFQLECLPFTSEADGEVINRDHFMLMLQLYEAWNSKKESEVGVLVDNYIERIGNSCGFTENDFRIAESDVDVAMKKHNSVIEYENEIEQTSDELSEKLQALRDEFNSKTAHEEKLKQFICAQELEIEKLETETVNLQKDNEMHLDQHKELNSLIGKQSMTIVERDKILKSCTEIQNYMKQFEDHLDEIAKEEWTLDIKHAHVIENLRKAILAYNTDIVINVAQDKNQLKFPESSLARSDIMIDLNEKVDALMNVKESMIKQIKNCESSIEGYTNELESLQEKKKMMDQEASEWLKKINEKRDCIKNLKLNANNEETTLRESIKKLENEKKHLEQSIPDVKSVTDDIEEAREKLEAVERRKVFLERSAERFFAQFFEILSNDRKEMIKMMENIDKS